MQKNDYSRREFIKQNSLAGVGAALALTTPSLFAGILADDVKSELIIDIHQHTDYSGRTNEQLLTHQRAMGITTTILLPAGRSVISASTHEGISNGLQAKATGNKVCYNFAQMHPKEFLFGANEVPDLPDAIREIENYLKSW